MSRSQSFNLTINCLLVIFCLQFFSCKNKEDVFAPANTLKKGVLVGEPLFKIDGKTITTIEAPTWDENLVKNGFKLRPNNTLDYFDLINFNKYFATGNRNNKQVLFNVSSSGTIQLQSVPLAVDLIFNWNPIVITNQKLENDRIVIALFKNVIQVSELKNEILNKEDIVWMGFDYKAKNAINFLDGKMVEYDKATQKIVKTFSPKIEDLKPGIYVWAIWAYNADGTEIAAASREIPFRVSNL